MLRNKTAKMMLAEQATSFEIAIVELREIMLDLRADNKRKDEMIEKLWEKLLAKDLPELSTYGRQPEIPGLDISYDPFSDEDNAGEILDATKPD